MFYARIFRTNIVSAAFSSYVLALGRNLYKKAAHKMLLKLTPAPQCLDLVFSVWKMINVWDNKTDPGNQGHSWSNSSFSLVDRKKAHNGVRELSVFNTILAFENPLKRLKQVVCEYQEIWQIKRFCQFIPPNRHLLICRHFYPFFDAAFFESRVNSS